VLGTINNRWSFAALVVVLLVYQYCAPRDRP
jgi:hypothetical protein